MITLGLVFLPLCVRLVVRMRGVVHCSDRGLVLQSVEHRHHLLVFWCVVVCFFALVNLHIHQKSCVF